MKPGKMHGTDLMRKLAGYLFLMLIFIPPAFAANSPETAPSPGKRELWVATMQRDLPKALCQPEHYFVKCFEVTEAQCLENTALYVKGCLDSILLALPDELNKEQGEHWGQLVGRCSFDLYEKFMESKKRKLPECDIKATGK